MRFKGQVINFGTLNNEGRIYTIDSFENALPRTVPIINNSKDRKKLGSANVYMQKDGVYADMVFDHNAAAVALGAMIESGNKIFSVSSGYGKIVDSKVIDYTMDGVIITPTPANKNLKPMKKNSEGNF